MHVRDLVEVAAVVALNGPRMMRGAGSFSQPRLEQYWASSKCRFESWHRALECFTARSTAHRDEGFDNPIQLRATLDEIFVGEMLARVFSAVVVGHDRMRRASIDEPLVRSVLVSHMEARRRALALLLHPRGFSTRQALAINRTRRRAERWTDMLIGGLLAECDVREFAVEADRALDFGQDLAERRTTPRGRQSLRLVIVSLRGAFGRGLCPAAANPDANARITASILGCIPGELLDSSGLFPSLWMMRLAAAASDAEVMIDELLGSASALEAAAGNALPRGLPR